MGLSWLLPEGEEIGMKSCIVEGEIEVTNVCFSLPLAPLSPGSQTTP